MPKLTNVQKLENAGYTIKTPLPHAYEKVLEGMSSEEISALVKLKKRLDKAEATTEREVGSYYAYFHPF